MGTFVPVLRLLTISVIIEGCLSRFFTMSVPMQKWTSVQTARNPHGYWLARFCVHYIYTFIIIIIYI